MPIAAAQNADTPSALRCPRGRQIALGDRPLVMGVLNLTPDSFSDGGLWLEPARAVERAQTMVAEGAELLDLGAESSRPGGGIYGEGARAVGAREELDRLLPVLTQVRARVSVPISVDTRKATVAEAALEAGADLINDISALGDPRTAEVVAAFDCPVVLMHSRGSLESMQRDIRFDDVVSEVCCELEQSIERAIAAGVRRDQIVVDPGIGFGKTTRQNLELLRNLDRLSVLGRPILVGASRKSFVGDLTGQPVGQRLGGSLAAVGWTAHHGAAIARIHDVSETVQFLRVWQAIHDATGDDA